MRLINKNKIEKIPNRKKTIVDMKYPQEKKNEKLIMDLRMLMGE